MGPKRLPQDEPKMGPRPPKMTPKSSQAGPYNAQAFRREGSTIFPEKGPAQGGNKSPAISQGPQMAQDGPKMAQASLKIAPNGPGMFSLCLVQRQREINKRAADNVLVSDSGNGPKKCASHGCSASHESRKRVDVPKPPDSLMKRSRSASRIGSRTLHK